MPIKPEDLLAIRKIIEDAHHAFIVNYVSPKAVPPDVLKRLQSLGLVKEDGTTIEDAYLYGRVVAALKQVPGQYMSLAAFQNYVKANPVPLSESELAAVKMANLRAAQYIVGLGNRVNQQTGELMIEADAKLRAQYQNTVRSKLEQNIARRETVQQLKSDLGHATQNWTRDLDRIALTEKQQALQDGIAATIAQRSGGETLVYKILANGSCDKCKELLIGPDGAPRVFKLSELQANGSNVGRKRADWKACTGPLHPACRCLLQSLNPGSGFNERGQQVANGKLGTMADGSPLRRSVQAMPTLRKAKARPPIKMRLGLKKTPVF